MNISGARRLLRLKTFFSNISSMEGHLCALVQLNVVIPLLPPLISY